MKASTPLLFAVTLGLTIVVLTPRLTLAESPAPKALSERQLERLKEKNQREAREAMAKDAKAYGGKEMADLEALYQAGNANPRTPEAHEKFKEVLSKYPKSNRAGCACLYLGQYAKDAREKEKYLEKAVKEYSQCFYLNGTQVGGFGRLLLADFLKGQSKDTQSKKVLAEIVKDYDSAMTHNGKSVAEIAQSMLNGPAKP